MVMGPSPGPAPAAHARPMRVSATRSSWRMWPKVKLRRKVPSATSHHPVAEHGRGGPGTKQLGVIDAVGPGDDRVQQGQHLAARPVMAGPVAEVDQPIDGCLDPQAVSQRGR